ncbi:MAG: hypothetical protein H6712_34545 [Myxococcales bacterium]|nr:hypothetical protein [Myxococcales bacterium]MCB9719016.1 hypothetical protein [Myxococcales bacterium]
MEKFLEVSLLRNMGHSEYDAAWVARVADPRTGDPLFPSVLDVVRKSQGPDGGWACDLDYPSARVLATLASVLAITSYDHLDARRDAERAVDFVGREIEKIDPEHVLTIAYELVLVALLREVNDRGFQVEGLIPGATRLQSEKLARLPSSVVYDPRLSTSFSLEFLGDELDREQLERVVLRTGSVGGSVGTTAYCAMRTGDVRMVEYLRKVVSEHGPGNIPYGWPVTVWPLMWVMYHAQLAGVPLPRHREREALAYIDRVFGQDGLTWCEDLEYQDSDDTSIALALLGDRASERQWRALDKFETEQGFLGFLGERGPSVSANAHVLTALQKGRHPEKQRMIERAFGFLIKNRLDDGLWLDKWHASPLYPTSRAIIALVSIGAASEARTSISWLLDTQRDNGGWGFYEDATLEESSYAVHALVSAHRLSPSRGVARALERACRFLQRPQVGQGSDVHPKLWITKVLYRPMAVVLSAIAAARAMSSEFA